MSEEKKETKLGLLLKSLMKERSLSMRKLSSLTGIDTATISRIINGKQPPRINHLQQLSICLGIPMERLLESAEIIQQHSKESEFDLDIYSSVHDIQKTLETSDLFNNPFTRERVEQELSNFEQYAKTEEGQRIILKQFHEKVKQVSGIGPFIEHLKQMYEQFEQGNITPAERAILGSALLYFILSTDIIPDYLFPIGYLDDAIAVKLVLKRLSQLKQNEN